MSPASADPRTAVAARASGGGLLVAGIALVACAVTVTALRVVAGQPKALIPLVGFAVVSTAVMRWPGWIVPLFAGMTWMALGDGAFGGLPSPVTAGMEVLLIVALWRAVRDPGAAAVPLLLAGLIVAPMLASALLSQVPIGTLADALKEPAFLLVAALCLRGVRDVRNATIVLSACSVVLGVGASLSVLTGPSALFGVRAEDGVTRASGPLGEPNFFALSLAALVPFALLHIVAGGRRRVLGVASLLAIAAGVLATGSRGGMLSSLVAVVAFALVAPGRHRRVILTAMVVGVAALAPLFATQLNHSASRTTSGRQTENLVALHMFADHPVAGVGPGEYPYLYRDYTRHYGDDTRSLREPHSLPLQIAAEEGVGGILAWLAAGAALLGVVLRRRVWETMLGRALVLSVGTYLVGSLFLHGSELRMLFLLVGMVLAFAAALPERAR